MDFGFTEEQKMLRDSVRKLMDKHASPEYIRRLEREQAYPYELYDEWIKAGILAMPFPENTAGSAAMRSISRSSPRRSPIAAPISRWRSAAACSAASTSCARRPRSRSNIGCRSCLSGEIRMSISMSEPDAGSDIGAMRTTAVLDGNEWVINGQKLWATGAAAKNNVINLYVKTDTKAHYRQGMSLFLVDKDTPGIELRKLDMLGRRCTGTYEMFLKDVRVPADRLVGGEAGLNKGFDFVLSGLQVERVVSAAGSCGGARAVVDLASTYAKERKQFGKPIGTFQAIAHMLADMETEVEAARSLMWRAAWMVASGQNALKEITMAKLFAARPMPKVANMGMQVLGGYGYNKEFDMERHYRDARVATVAAGSSQIQRNLIANLMGHKVQ